MQRELKKGNPLLYVGIVLIIIVAIAVFYALINSSREKEMIAPSDVSTEAERQQLLEQLGADQEVTQTEEERATILENLRSDEEATTDEDERDRILEQLRGSG